MLREPLLKHVEIQYIITNTSTKGKVLGSQQGDWNVRKLGVCHGLARIEGGKGSEIWGGF